MIEFIVGASVMLVGVIFGYAISSTKKPSYDAGDRSSGLQ